MLKCSLNYFRKNRTGRSCCQLRICNLSEQYWIVWKQVGNDWSLKQEGSPKCFRFLKKFKCIIFLHSTIMIFSFTYLDGNDLAERWDHANLYLCDICVWMWNGKQTLDAICTALELRARCDFKNRSKPSSFGCSSFLRSKRIISYPFSMQSIYIDQRSWRTHRDIETTSIFSSTNLKRAWQSTRM